MLFSRNTKKRDSKPKDIRSGQAWPILLLCIIGLVVANFSTKTVGDANIDQTAASNGADSGSLSAASVEAGAFNRLVYRNWDRNSTELPTGAGHKGKYMGYSGGDYYYYKEMNYYYTQMRNRYGEVYNDGSTYLDEALTNAVAALGNVSSALSNIYTGGDCQVWDWLHQASLYDSWAADQLEIAAKAVGAFYVDAYYMNMIANWFWQIQLGSDKGNGHLKDALDFMDQSYKGAKRTGQYYAITNTNYSSKLGSPDAFNFWLSGGARGDGFNTSGGSSVTFPSNGTGCSVTAKVEIPKIQKYTIKMAIWNWAKKHDLKSIPCCWPVIPKRDHPGDVFDWVSARDLSNDMRVVAAELRKMSTEAESIYQLTVNASQCCDCFGPVGRGCKRCYPPKYQDARTRTTLLQTHQTCVRDWLTSVCFSIGSGDGPDSIPVLQTWNNAIWLNLWPDPSGSGLEHDISNYGEALTYCDVNCDHKGMMVIDIKEAFVPGKWLTDCSVSISCGGSAHSTSWFDGYPRGTGQGELIGEFKDVYYPEKESN